MLAFLLFSAAPDGSYCASTLSLVSIAVSAINPTTLLFSAAGSSSAAGKNAALVNGQRAVGQRTGDLAVLIDFNRLAAALTEDAAVDNQLAAGDISSTSLRP